MSNTHLHKAKRQKNDEAARQGKRKYYLKHKTPDSFFLQERRENYNPEEWKPLPRCNDYEVSIYGEVYYKGNIEGNPRRKSGICVQHTGRNGYKTVALNYNGKKVREYTHRLIAETWIPNPDNRPEIDHIIPVREGGTNEISNLRWVTHKENYSNERTREHLSIANTGKHHTDETKQRISQTERNRPDRSKPVRQYTLFGVFVAEYPSAMEANRQTGTHYSGISECCNGNQMTAGGFKWQFVEQ